MSRQGQWGTVKATNARAAALYYEVSNVGKTIESSKKRVIWRLKVEEGRDFEISLTHSLASGKKVLRVDGIVKYTSQSLSFGDWDYVFNLAGGHCVHIIIKPSVDLNDMYDLIVDGMSFRRLPERLDPTKFHKPQDNVVTSATRTGGPGSRNSSFTYHYSNGGGYGGNSTPGSRNSSRESSFSPWECTRCTLVNDKPLAPICEACGHPKPDYISPESRQRAKTVASSPTPSPSSRRPATESPVVFDMWPTSASPPAFPAFTDSDGFPMASTPASVATRPAAMPSRPPFQQDITSMLSGLDFTPAPVEETSPPVAAPVEPTPTEEDKTAAGDLWASNMVDLNLKPEDKLPVQRSARSYQTLEQARQLAPKEKVQVLPAPPSMAFPTYNAQQTPAGFYGPMTYNTVATTGAFGMGLAPAPMGFGGSQMSTMQTHGGYGGQQASPFMTAAPMNAPPRQASMQNLGNDPFATLS